MNGLRQRKYWVDTLIKIAHPVLNALADQRLKAIMPTENESRREFMYLEALGRTLSGMAPWLEKDSTDSEENRLRKEFAELARRALDAATDPLSPDYCNFSEKNSAAGRPAAAQPLVDSAFLCRAILMAPNELWHKLEDRVKNNVIASLKQSRTIVPFRNNWVLFSAMVETGLQMMGEEADLVHVDYALHQLEQWYKGDGVYGDGLTFCWDYYNSFVIHPMLLDIISVFKDQFVDKNLTGRSLENIIIRRAKRYAAIQEMLIAPDGSFPAIGRSVTYRCGAFQLLAQMALNQELPEELSPAQVRCALTAVIQRCMDAPETFDAGGWLKIGLYGSQPELGEGYISTGSLYLCATAFLPLGLGPEDEFWSAPPAKWSSQKVWSGENVHRDHAMY